MMPRLHHPPGQGEASRHGALAGLYIALGFVLLVTACVAVGVIACGIFFVLFRQLIPHWL